jgi:hypothetical protein
MCGSFVLKDLEYKSKELPVLNLSVNFVPCAIKVSIPTRNENNDCLLLALFSNYLAEISDVEKHCPCYSDRCQGKCCLTPQTARRDLGSLPIKKRIT